MAQRLEFMATPVLVGTGVLGGYLLGSQRRRNPPSQASPPPLPIPPTSSPPAAAMSAAQRAEQSFCRYGLPSDEHVVCKQGYASSLSYRLRIPNWVAEHYSASDVDGEGVDRKHSKFAADPEVPAAFRAGNEDYRGSKLSRGHLAPAGAHKTSQVLLLLMIILPPPPLLSLIPSPHLAGGPRRDLQPLGEYPAPGAEQQRQRLAQAGAIRAQAH